MAELVVWWNRTTALLDDLQNAVAAIRYECRKPGALVAPMFDMRSLIDLEIDLSTAAGSMCSNAPVLPSAFVPPPAGVYAEPYPRD